MEPRITLITLGVADLPRAVRFYRDGLGWPTTYLEDAPVAFFETSGARLALYPTRELVADISPDVPTVLAGFSGITLAHNARSKSEVDDVIKLAKRAGATIVKPAQDVFWGGYSGYFRDLDGHYWEVAWNPILPLDEKGVMNLRPEGSSSSPAVSDDGFSKVENALRLCLIASIAGLASFVIAHGVKLVTGVRGELWFTVLMLIAHTLLAGIVAIPAYLIWRKRYRELVDFGVVGAAVVLNLFLMLLPSQLGLFEWAEKWAFSSTSPLILHVVTIGLLFYLSLVFPYRAASWFYRKASSLAHKWLFRRQPMTLGTADS